MAKYAADTGVSSASSRAEIERSLERYGASAFGYGWENNRARVAFTIADRDVSITLPLPDKGAREFTHTPSRGYRRDPDAIQSAYEQGVRQRWRALALVIKAKLEAVEAGISTIEREFLADVVVGEGTVGDYVQPKIVEYYAGRQLEAGRG